MSALCGGARAGGGSAALSRANASANSTGEPPIILMHLEPPPSLDRGMNGNELEAEEAASRPLSRLSKRLN